MPLDSNTVWGQQVAAAVQSVGVAAGTPVTNSQLEAVWAAIKNIDRTQLTTKMEAAGTTNVTSGSSAGTYASLIPAGGHT